jgi:hypothetical protein
MNIVNITSKGISLDINGQSMQREVYEREIKKLQSNWNSLREFVKENGFYERQDIIDAICNPNEDKLIYIDDVLDKMNELERNDKN